MSYSSSWTKSHTNYSAVQVTRSQTAGGGLNVLIKPKERVGQSMQAKTINNKNSLMEIGSVSSEISRESKVWEWYKKPFESKLSVADMTA